jgi:ABC-type Na+ transport system ATPase subunit NatA
MIEIKNLTMKYKNGKGVSDISISVDNGEVKGFTRSKWCRKINNNEKLNGFLKILGGFSYS